MKSPVPQSNGGSSSKESIVFVVDDDPIVRGAIGSLLLSVGQQVQQYGSATELLQKSLPEAASCLILDIRLPGLGGLDLQVELAKADVPIPIIFITGHGDIPMSVKAMKEGAVDFLTKPFRDQDLLDAVARALERDRERRDDARESLDLRAKFRTLTLREKQTMALVTDGLLNKQIAGKMGISVDTAKIHRGRVMRKMGAKSLADLVIMADALGTRGKPPLDT
jgi:FixJ family two-component response regulator